MFHLDFTFKRKRRSMFALNSSILDKILARIWIEFSESSLE